jgi:hypothetical protein
MDKDDEDIAKVRLALAAAFVHARLSNPNPQPRRHEEGDYIAASIADANALINSLEPKGN